MPQKYKVAIRHDGKADIFPSFARLSRKNYKFVTKLMKEQDAENYANNVNLRVVRSE